MTQYTYTLILRSVQIFTFANMFHNISSIIPRMGPIWAKEKTMFL
jgi:hypothetical protein